MKLETNAAANGNHTGEEVWICDYRYNDFDNKPIRHVKPTKVTIVDISETKNKVYYSEVFFREGNKKSSVIKLFDNTGYRSYTGVALNVFTTEEECKQHYLEQKKKLKKDFKQYKEAILHRLASIEEDLSN